MYKVPLDLKHPILISPAEALDKKMETQSSILPGEFYRQKTPVRYSLWDHKESDMTEQLTQTQKKIKSDLIISSVSQSMSDSLQLHGPQHARLPCQSPTPGA